ncbi:hypothetical protein V8E55_009292 [Tylopilus felleus]
MLHMSSFHFRKTKNMPSDYYARKPTGRHRFRDVSHMKLTDIFKSLRRRRLRSDVFRRSALTHSRSFPPPLADHDSPPIQICSPNLFASSSARYCSDAVNILSVTEKECSSGICTSSSVLASDRCLVEREPHLSPRPIPAFQTSPSAFQLRSASTKDYLVDALEQHLRQLSLGDASPVHKSSSSRDVPMCLDVPIDPETSLQRTLSDSHAQKPTSLPHDQNAVPMILITSVDAKHARPLPPSSQRPSRTPFGPSNFIDHPTDIHAAKSKLKTLPDDPFRTQPHTSAYPPDYSPTFRLPSFPSASSTSSEYSPETPTPMCCDHFGDCRGDMWEVLHPPLVAGRFTLPPFKLPSMSTGLFDDMPPSLPY